jgi:hypothetical protein
MLNPKKNTKLNKRLDKLVVYFLICGSILMGCAVSFYFIGHYMVDKNLHNVNYKMIELSQVTTSYLF